MRTSTHLLPAIGLALVTSMSGLAVPTAEASVREPPTNKARTIVCKPLKTTSGTVNRCAWKIGAPPPAKPEPTDPHDGGGRMPRPPAEHKPMPPHQYCFYGLHGLECHQV